MGSGPGTRGRAAWGWGEGLVMQWGAGTGAGSPGRTGCQLPGWVAEGDSFARALLLLGALELTSFGVWPVPPEGFKTLRPVELEGQVIPSVGSREFGKSMKLGPAG